MHWPSSAWRLLAVVAASKSFLTCNTTQKPEPSGSGFFCLPLFFDQLQEVVSPLNNAEAAGSMIVVWHGLLACVGSLGAPSPGSA